MLAVVTAAIRMGSGTGSGRRISASAKLNMAEVAPIPMASEQMLTSVNPGLSTKAAKRGVRTSALNDTRRSPDRESSIELYRDHHFANLLVRFQILIGFHRLSQRESFGNFGMKTPVGQAIEDVLFRQS